MLFLSVLVGGFQSVLCGSFVNHRVLCNAKQTQLNFLEILWKSLELQFFYPHIIEQGLATFIQKLVDLSYLLFEQLRDITLLSAYFSEGKAVVFMKLADNLFLWFYCNAGIFDFHHRLILQR